MVKSRSHGVILLGCGGKREGKEQGKKILETQEDFGPCVRGGTSLYVWRTPDCHKNKSRTTTCYYKTPDENDMWISRFKTIPRSGFYLLWRLLAVRVKVQEASVIF